MRRDRFLPPARDSLDKVQTLRLLSSDVKHVLDGKGSLFLFSNCSYVVEYILFCCLLVVYFSFFFCLSDDEKGNDT